MVLGLHIKQVVFLIKWYLTWKHSWKHEGVFLYQFYWGLNQSPFLIQGHQRSKLLCEHSHFGLVWNKSRFALTRQPHSPPTATQCWALMPVWLYDDTLKLECQTSPKDPVQPSPALQRLEAVKAELITFHCVLQHAKLKSKSLRVALMKQTVWAVYQSQLKLSYWQTVEWWDTGETDTLTAWQYTQMAKWLIAKWDGGRNNQTGENKGRAHNHRDIQTDSNHDDKNKHTKE